MTHVEQAQSLFQQGFNCSQAVLGAFGSEFGLDEETSLRVAGGFGGGIGRMAGVCGAVTGAVVVLGLAYGQTVAGDGEAKARCYARVQEFLRLFTAKHGTTVCKELLGCDMSTEAGFAEAKARDVHHTLCPAFVQSAVELLEEML